MSTNNNSIADNASLFGDLFDKHFNGVESGFGPEFYKELESLKSWDGAGWSKAYNKPEGLIWASFSVYKNFKADFEAAGDTGAIGRMRADFRYGEYLSDAIRGIAKTSAWEVRDENGNIVRNATDSAITANVFTTLDFIPNLIAAYTSYKVESATRDIRAFHAEGGQDGYTYEPGELAKFNSVAGEEGSYETDFAELVKLHKAILQRKQDAVSEQLNQLDNQISAAQQAISEQILAKELQKDAALVTYIALETGNSQGIIGEIEVTELLISEDQTALSQKQARITEIEAAAGDDGSLTEAQINEVLTLRQETADLEETLTRRNAELDNYRQTKIEVDNLLTQDAASIEQQITQNKASYQTFSDEAWDLRSDRAALPYSEEYTSQRTQLESTQRDLNVDLVDADSSLATHTSHELLNKGLSLGSNLLTVASSAAGLAQTLQSDGDNKAGVAQAATGLSGFIVDSISSALDFVEGSKAATKAGAALGGIGAAAGVAASGVGISILAKQLEDPNLTTEQRQYLTAEIGVQGAVAGLSAVAGGLAVAQALTTAGTTAANALSKAVPIVGAIASVASAINPAKWSEFNDKQDRIDNLRDSDDYSAGLLADLLDENLVADKAFYGATTALNAVTGVVSAGLAATGVGAGVAVLVGLIGGAVSAIIGAFQQVALEDIADRYADKIRTNDDGSPRTVEEFFKGSFDQQQEKAKEAYQDVLQDIIDDQGFDSAVTLGSQLLTGTDLELAALSKTRGELEKNRPALL